MKILVCLKQILDPEISPRDFQIDGEKREAVQGNANLVTNIFCENALEMALQVREKAEGEITAVCFGPESGEETLRKALALKVDHVFRVENPGIAHTGSAGAACVLAAAIKKIGEFDVIMLGRESGDWGEGRTAPLVAEHLGMPFVQFVDTIEDNGDELSLGRQTDFGRETVTASKPVVLSITNNDHNVPRIPKTRDIMMAHRKELTNWTLADVGLDEDAVKAAASGTEIVDLFIPEKTTECEFIEGDSIDEKLDKLAEKITGVLQSI